MVYNGLFFFYGIDKALGRFESRDIVCRNGHGGFAGDVAGGLLGTVLDDEAAETAEVHRVACNQGAFDHIGKFLYHCQNLGFLNTGSLCYFVYNFCLSQSFYSFNRLVFNLKIMAKLALFFQKTKSWAKKGDNSLLARRLTI